MTTTFGFWTWWSTLILLLLRFTYGDDDMDTLNITSITDAPPTTTTPSGPASADKLGVPRCESNYDCVHNGLCRKDTDGYGRCLCPRSCPPYIPMDCMKQGTSSYYRLRQRYRHELPCGVMDSNYAKKYDLPSPQCHLVSDLCFVNSFLELVIFAVSFCKNSFPWNSHVSQLIGLIFWFW
ncbi:hypothetical protein ANCCAN_25819 [Ancylostoma caninum]|uniref:EGF-like domain-containing protein n=1 Tax=Ancylostoma caninum TaxID=29170 RepID=A0A368FE18_ANCCA|nr:hypothetical protein ANCCAN_25819 [Ancylostoma caninum]